MSEHKETKSLTSHAELDAAIDAHVTSKIEELTKLFPGPTNAVHVSRYHAQLLNLAANYKSTGGKGGKILGISTNTPDDVYSMFEENAVRIMAAAEAESETSVKTDEPLLGGKAAHGLFAKWLNNANGPKHPEV